MRVLVAEDDPFCRRFLENTLAKWGYQVVPAGDGQAAWEIICQDDPPKLAILDWMMPGLDGLELCRRIRDNDATATMYVIMLTAKGEVEDLVQAMDAGADDFTTKSFDVRELRVRLRAAQRIVTLEESLRRLATRDALTGLWNRRAILECLSREIARTQRGSAGLGVIMADVDHFKRVNDSFGHEAGDAVLAEVARRLRAGLRQYDSAGRYGGEEFLLIVPGVTADELAGTAERLRQAVSAQPIQVPCRQVKLTISLGTVVWPGEKAVGGEDLVRAADAAMYQAKHAGRNRVCSAAACDAAAPVRGGG